MIHLIYIKILFTACKKSDTPITHFKKSNSCAFVVEGVHKIVIHGIPHLKQETIDNNWRHSYIAYTEFE